MAVRKKELHEPKPDRDDIAARLRAVRAGRRETQRQMAQALGVTQKNYSEFERGLSVPRITQMREACKAWGMTVDEFLSFQLPPGASPIIPVPFAA